jgi:hypothetical protein
MPDSWLRMIWVRVVLQLVEAAHRHGRVAGHRGVHIEQVPGPAQPHIFFGTRPRASWSLLLNLPLDH